MIVTLTGLACRLVAQAPQRPAAEAAEQAHAELWRRFVDRHGILLDFTALDGTVELPTPEECRAGQPNALGWWSPTENGAMFNGLYLDAAVNRWRHTRSADDAAKVRRLVGGLVLLASLSEVPGFVGRGVSTDGRSHYPLGSDDQTLPWFFGLWRYLDSGLATPDERARIVAKLAEVAEAVAHEQLRVFLRHFPRRGVETAFVREPTAAAWIVTLTPDESVLAARRAAVERVIARYDYARLHYSTFFWAESAWWRLTAPPVLR